MTEKKENEPDTRKARRGSMAEHPGHEAGGQLCSAGGGAAEPCQRYWI